MPDLGELRSDVEIVPKKIDNEPSYRPVVGASLGCELGGLALPHVDTTDPETTLGGLGKRLAFKPPAYNKVKLRKIKRFVQRWCKNNLTPLSPDSDTSFETWLAGTSYTNARKDALREVYRQLLEDPYYKNSHRDKGVDCFVKDETYPEYKYPRGIYSRTDTFKVLVGPIIKLIEHELYSTKSMKYDLPYFIKNVPVSERPQMLMNMYTLDAFYAATDYTSFEGHFKKKIMMSIECQLYEYMIQYLPQREWFESEFLATILGVNECNFYYFILKVEATRMSGEMNTSLGNGFSNLMMMLFICEEKGIPEPPGFVEGDDGIFRFNDRSKVPIAKDFLELGFTIKIEWHTNLSTASFCGIVFSEEDLNNVTSPIDALLSFGWTTRRYSRSNKKVYMELLRAKAFSMLYSYPGCPILRKLAEYGIRVTEGYHTRFNIQNVYQSEKAKVVMKTVFQNEMFSKIKIGNSTRCLIAERYGIPVDTQILFEEYLDSLDCIQTLDSDLLFSFVNKDVLDYSVRYVVDVDYKRRDLDYLPSANVGVPLPFSRMMVTEMNEKRQVLVKKL